MVNWWCWNVKYQNCFLGAARSIAISVCNKRVVTTGACRDGDSNSGCHSCKPSTFTTEVSHYSPTPARVPVGYLHTPDTEVFHYSPTPARVPAGYLHTPDTELSHYSPTPAKVPAGYLHTPDTEVSHYPALPFGTSFRNHTVWQWEKTANLLSS